MKQRSQPPRLVVRFFRWFCHPALLDSIEGDLMELYYERVEENGRHKANINFIMDVILLFRPGIIRPSEGYQKINQYGMIKSYLKVGWRNLLRNKGYSIINIGGLSMGITVAILIGLWVNDELNYNKNYENYDSIAKVYRYNTFANTVETNLFSVTGLGTLLRSEYGDYFKHVAMVRGSEDRRVLQFGENRFTQRGYLMQTDGPAMLELEMEQGSWTGYTDKNTILISSSLADKLFGVVDPLNQVIQMDAKYDLKVVGVYKDLPGNAEFHDATYFAPLELYFGGNMDMNVWDNYNVFIYVQLQPGYTFEGVSEIIKDAMLPHVDERTAETNPELFLLPMSEWHLNSEFENGVQVTSSKMQSVWYFSIIGGFVLLLACINFMNLSTARSERRAKEVGIRKSIGSARSQLVYQFFSESLMVALISFVVAIVWVQMLLPSFNTIADKHIVLPWGSVSFWGVGLGITFLTGILAGSYPALYLSSFNPVKVLKGTFKVGNFASAPRRVLVVLQFCISVILIVGTGIVYQQMMYGKDRPVGYTREGLISLRLGAYENRGDLETLRNELKATGMVSEIGEANYQVTSTLGWNDDFRWRDRDEDLSGLSFNTIYVTNGYAKTVGLEFVAGRDFSPDFSTDGQGMIINETAAKNLGVENPVGETIIWNRNGQGYPYTILGVVKDMVKGSPFAKTDPSMLFLSTRSLEYLYIRIHPEVSTHEALPLINKTFTALMPAVPFDYTFADDDYNLKFRSEERIGILAAIFSVLAIVISCLGLLGLASFTAAQRTKEIGIRKVLGASVSQIWGLLCKEFVFLVILACMIALPLGYVFMSSWLENYEYRTSISWYVFVISGVVALVITLVTVSFQAIKAGISNPVKSLRAD
ncbi:MAG: ABC transporter permease [Cyclobacteriaceae bacterium]